MDDLLYTLFVVAWIAYGIYKGVKKNNQPKKQTVPQNNPKQKSPAKSKVESRFESIFDEVFDISASENDEIGHPYSHEQVEKPMQKAPVYEKYAEKEVLDSYKGSDNITSVFEQESDDVANADQSDKIFDNQTEGGDGHENNTVFDLRQAVIHQVILERPY